MPQPHPRSALRLTQGLAASGNDPLTLFALSGGAEPRSQTTPGLLSFAPRCAIGEAKRTNGGTLATDSWPVVDWLAVHSWTIRKPLMAHCCAVITEASPVMAEGVRLMANVRPRPAQRWPGSGRGRPNAD